MKFDPVPDRPIEKCDLAYISDVKRLNRLIQLTAKDINRKM